MAFDYWDFFQPILVSLAGSALIFFPCFFLKNKFHHWISGILMVLSFTLALTLTLIRAFNGLIAIGWDVDYLCWVLFASMLITYLVFLVVWGNHQDRTAKASAKANEEKQIDIKNL
jgi:uncharacterized membrane protein